MAARALAFLALLSMYLALPVHAAVDAGVPDASVSPSPSITVSTPSSTPVTAPMPGEYAVLVGGVMMVVAFFVRRLTNGWFHTQTGGLVIVLVSTALTSCAEAVQKHGISKSVIVSALGSAALTFVAMSNSQKPPTDASKS